MTEVKNPTLRDLARQVRDAPPEVQARSSPHFVKHMIASAERYDYMDRAIIDGRVKLTPTGNYEINGKAGSMARALMLLRGYI